MTPEECINSIESNEANWTIDFDLIPSVEKKVTLLLEAANHDRHSPFHHPFPKELTQHIINDFVKVSFKDKPISLAFFKAKYNHDTLTQYATEEIHKNNSLKSQENFQNRINFRTLGLFAVGTIAGAALVAGMTKLNSFRK